jgi:hypothetical protein
MIATAMRGDSGPLGVEEDFFDDDELSVAFFIALNIP